MFKEIEKFSEDELKQKMTEYQKERVDIQNILSRYKGEYRYNNEIGKSEYGYYNKETGEPAQKEVTELFSRLKKLNRDIDIIKYRIRGFQASKLESHLIKMIVLDKKSNPENYPEWLKFDISVSYLGYLELNPIIDIYKLLESKGDLLDATKVIRRIDVFWRKYIGNTVLRIADTEYKGFDEYAKKVFNKEIRKRIKEEVDPNGRLHSVVFKKPIRQYGVTSTTYFQIVPRFKKTYSSKQFERKSVIVKKLENLLKEYGWIRGLNYQDTLER